MNLTKFKKLNKLYSKFPLPKGLSDSTEYEEYIEAFQNNKTCQEWELKRLTKKAKIDYKKYCCLRMAYYLIEYKNSKNKRKINYDSVIMHTPKRKEFGIPIHDGGSSYIQINNCPWCGKKL